MNILLIGYYGYRNLGDDLMLNGFSKFLESNTSIDKVTIPAKECYYKFQSTKISQVYLPKSYKEWLRIIKANDLIIWGGGTCLYSNPGLNWLLIISCITFLLGKKLLFIGIGVDYPQSIFDKIKIKTILNISNKIGVRDPKSLDNCIFKYNLKENKIYSIDDLAYLSLNPKNLSAHTFHNPPKKISFSGHYEFISKKTINFYTSLLISLLNQNTELELHFLPAHGGQFSDDNQHTLIYNKIPDNLKNRVILHRNLSPEEFVETLSFMDFHIGFRLHSIFLSKNLSIPFIAINYAPKVESYVKSVNGDFINLHVPFGLELINSIQRKKDKVDLNIAQKQQYIYDMLSKIIFS